MQNKRGQALSNLVSFSIFIFAFVILLGITLYYYGQINEAITDKNIITGSQGDINISNYSAETVGVLNTALLDQADLIGVMFIFGVVLFIFVAGYLNRDNTPILFLSVDIVILIIAYIVSVYMTNAYETVLTQLPFLNLITNNLNTTSNLMLNLPPITVVTGIFTIILTYAGIPRSRESEVAGF